MKKVVYRGVHLTNWVLGSKIVTTLPPLNNTDAVEVWVQYSNELRTTHKFTMSVTDSGYKPEILAARTGDLYEMNVELEESLRAGIDTDYAGILGDIKAAVS